MHLILNKKVFELSTFIIQFEWEINHKRTVKHSFSKKKVKFNQLSKELKSLNKNTTSD